MADTSSYYAYHSNAMHISDLIVHLQDILVKNGDLPVTISGISTDGQHFDVGVSDLAIDINRTCLPTVVIHEAGCDI
jgi:hypothetical protein